MKRSKIFLGATTALLAIAGVATAKHFTNKRGGFYITGLGTHCLATGNVLFCTKGGTANCLYTTTTTGLNNQVQAFTAGPGVVGSTICHNAITYLAE